MEEALLWYWLGNIKGIGIRKERKLLEQWKTPEQIFCAPEEKLKQIQNV